MIRRIALFVCAVVAWPAIAGAATGAIWMAPDTTYSQRDTSFVLVVHCDGNLTGVKGLQLDIDFNGSFVQPDTALLVAGSIWSSTRPYIKYIYVTNGGNRLTLDFAVLGDTFTVSGPGTVAIIPLNTVGFGESDITISSYRLRDNQNQPMSVTTKNAWVKVCRFVGDLDADNHVDISDIIALVDYLYITFTPPVPPMAVADIDCDDHYDISDLTRLVDYLYVSFTPVCRKCL